MPTVEPPLDPARLAEVFAHLEELVVLADESKPNHARSDVSRDNEVDKSITEPMAIRPAFVTRLLRFHFHGWTPSHFPDFAERSQASR